MFLVEIELFTYKKIQYKFFEVNDEIFKYFFGNLGFEATPRLKT